MHYGHGGKKKPAAKKANAKMKAKGVPAAVRKAVTMNMGKKK